MATGTLMMLGGVGVILGLSRKIVAKSNFRTSAKYGSNNKNNNNQNICLLRIAEQFGVASSKRYLHTLADLVKGVRKYSKFTVRSRTSQLKGKSLHKARAKLKELTEKEYIFGERKIIGYLVSLAPASKKTTAGHALFLDADGVTKVDTAPKFQTSGVRECYIVYRNWGAQFAQQFLKHSV